MKVDNINIFISIYESSQVFEIPNTLKRMGMEIHTLSMDKSGLGLTSQKA